MSGARRHPRAARAVGFYLLDDEHEVLGELLLELALGVEIQLGRDKLLLGGGEAAGRVGELAHGQLNLQRAGR